MISEPTVAEMVAWLDAQSEKLGHMARFNREGGAAFVPAAERFELEAGIAQWIARHLREVHDIPASGPQTARLCAKPDFGSKRGTPEALKRLKRS